MKRKLFFRIVKLSENIMNFIFYSNKFWIFSKCSVSRIFRSPTLPPVWPTPNFSPKKLSSSFRRVKHLHAKSVMYSSRSRKVRILGHQKIGIKKFFLTMRLSKFPPLRSVKSWLEGDIRLGVFPGLVLSLVEVRPPFFSSYFCSRRREGSFLHTKF